MYLVVEEAIRTALLASSGITSVVSSRVYAIQAPPGAALPFIVFQHQGGGDDNDTRLNSADLLYTVKGIGTAAQAVATLAATIRTVLHEIAPAIDSPYTVYNCREETPVRYSETVERVTYYHMGAVYRIRISE